MKHLEQTNINRRLISLFTGLTFFDSTEGNDETESVTANHLGYRIKVMMPNHYSDSKEEEPLSSYWFYTVNVYKDDTDEEPEVLEYNSNEDIESPRNVAMAIKYRFYDSITLNEKAIQENN